MDQTDQKIKEVKENILQKEKPKVFTKRVAIVYDGKQYSVRIPVEFAQKTEIDVDKDEFEFTLEIPKDNLDYPKLSGVLVEKK